MEVLELDRKRMIDCEYHQPTSVDHEVGSSPDRQRMSRGNAAVVVSSSSTNKQRQPSGMDGSVLRFRDVSFTVGGRGKKDRKEVLTEVSGTVKWGHVLAILGPSGAGKTTLINSLTLDALYGTPRGSVTLNGEVLTDRIFKQHCFVVKQFDNHWPYLTCRETLRYAARLLYCNNVGGGSTTANNIGQRSGFSTKAYLNQMVEGTIHKMGLQSCADTRNANMSGGQRRRLSIGVALLKQPTLLFLDEPTSGLDAAAASSIMQEIVRVAKEERIIIVCTIHQPSTKVFYSFDQIMLLSRGREAFTGHVDEVLPYFRNMGYLCPVDTNPAEFFLDLVNADFSDEAAVERLLDAWHESKPNAQTSSQTTQTTNSSSQTKSISEISFDSEEPSHGAISSLDRRNRGKEIMIMFSRHAKIMIRDPALYIGRCIFYLVSNSIFALIYWSARENTMDQMKNKFWVNIWLAAGPTLMGVVAVYGLNSEFKSVRAETKNGMLSGMNYVFAKSFLVVPFLYFSSLVSLGLPLYGMLSFPAESFGIMTALFTSLMFVFESAAEALSVWFEHPIIGMLGFMTYWFATFLFGGFMIPQRDLYWPFELFYHIMPFSYYIRSAMYELMSKETFESCLEFDEIPSLTGFEMDSPEVQGVLASGIVNVTSEQLVCIKDTPDVPGESVLTAFATFFPIFNQQDQTAFDIGMLLIMGVTFKLLYVVGVWYKVTRVSSLGRSDQLAANQSNPHEPPKPFLSTLIET